MNHKDEEFHIPLTEDLMRGHGILNRILLIFEEIIKRITHYHDFPIAALQESVHIIQSFIQNHHERFEEDYIFPLFEKHKQHLELIATFKEQHMKGRHISTQLEKLAEEKELSHVSKSMLKHLLQECITMYRHHEVHEDTEIFPALRLLMTEKEFEKLGELFKTIEEQLFDKHGFTQISKKLQSIEKELNIYELKQFTPKI